MKLIDFVSMYKHDKKYLICDNYESAETMLKHEDAYINNLERISILDLAKSIVIEYYAKNNKIKEINIISNEYKTILMSNILSENKSFIPFEAISDATVNELIRVMNIIRSAHEPTNKANERIKDIKLLINLYENILKEKELFDEISLIKYASSLSFKEKDGYFAILDNLEKKLTYIEKEFIKKIKKDIQIIDTTSDYEEDFEFMSVYGEFNEIYAALDDIKTKELALSDCEIVITNSMYEPIVRTALSKNNVPYAYTSNYNIYNHPYIAFIKDVINWSNNNFSYKDFKKIIENPCINQNKEYMIKEKDGKISKQYLYNLGVDAGIGYSKQRYLEFINRLEDQDKFFNDIKQRNLGIDVEYINKSVIEQYKEFLEKLMAVFDNKNASEMLQELIEIIKTGKNEYDNVVLDKLNSHIDALKEIKYANTFKEHNQIIENILANIKMKDDYAKNKLLVHLFNGFNILDRKYVYVIGMSYDAFELKLKDSPILTDEEIREYYKDETKDNIKAHYYFDYALTKGNERNSDFKNMIKSYDAHIVFIRSNYNTSEFRIAIPSLMYNELKGNKEEVEKKNSYFNFNTINNNEIVKRDISINRKLNLVRSRRAKDGHIIYELKRPLTASQLNSIMSCPLMYLYSLFYFPKDAKDEDPYKWLDSLDKGTLYHNVLEKYCRELIGISSKDLSDKYDEARFIEIFNEVVQSYKDNVVCPNEAIFASDVNDFKEDLIKYLNNLHKEFKEEGIQIKSVETIPDEEATSKKYISIASNGKQYDGNTDDKKELRISFKSNTRIDREDIYEETNKLRIIDYKTSKTVYSKEDLRHNLQWFVYSFLDDADSFEYHFLCNKKEDEILRKIITKDNLYLDEEVSLKLFDFFINENISTIDSSDDEESSCSYCDYKEICLKNMAVKKGGIK